MDTLQPPTYFEDDFSNSGNERLPVYNDLDNFEDLLEPYYYKIKESKTHIYIKFYGKTHDCHLDLDDVKVTKYEVLVPTNSLFHGVKITLPKTIREGKFRYYEDCNFYGCVSVLKFKKEKVLSKGKKLSLLHRLRKALVVS